MSKTSAKAKTTKSQANWPVERCEPQAVGMCPKRLERVHDVVRRYVDEGRVSGVLTMVARRGRLAHLECAGLMDLEARRPMSEDAIFRIYSMSKIITSVAALMLMEEGRFLLNEPVSHFLPEFKDLRVAVKGADGLDELVRPRREVTFHDLLTHTAGMNYDLYFEARDAGMTIQQFSEEYCKRPLKRQPGELWEYSVAVELLGRVIEVISGMAFDEFLQKRVFAPLGMTDTAFWAPPEKADRLAAMYKPDASGKLQRVQQFYVEPVLTSGAMPQIIVAAQKGRKADAGEDRWYLERPGFLSGGGGLVSTTSDYLRFALMLLNKGKLGDTRLLGKKTVELMTSDHLPASHPPLDFGFGFGLGVSVARRLGELRQIGSVGEFGWGGAAATQVWIDPQEDMVTMIMLQLLPTEKFLLMDLVKQAVYQAIVE
jgi:CubicO group peptidase (beta-lactamase class C family)